MMKNKLQTKQLNGGKCGVCGDPWNGRRENEAGGKYATGTIVKVYKVSIKCISHALSCKMTFANRSLR